MAGKAGPSAQCSKAGGFWRDQAGWLLCGFYCSLERQLAKGSKNKTLATHVLSQLVVGVPSS